MTVMRDMTARPARNAADRSTPDCGRFPAADAFSPQLATSGNRYLLLKTGVEWLSALFILVLALPLIAILAVLVKSMSRGPAFYSQIRLGRHGRPFRIYKLRTMTHRCEDQSGPVWSGLGDPRVTRLGRWLRNTHLDEIPQLWNVLWGEMSLIGPRPERPEIAERIERTLPAFQDRLKVRPGMTGLAQLTLGAPQEFEAVRRKLDYDLRYIQAVSFGLDLRIALATALYVLGSRIQAPALRVLLPEAQEHDASALSPKTASRPALDSDERLGRELRWAA